MCLSERSNSVVSLRHLTMSVAVQQHCAADEPSAIPRAFPCLFDSGFDDRKRVPATKKLKIKVDTELQRFVRYDLEQGSVALFALSLATQEESAPGRDARTAHPHPTFGTAPYTPPRYFL